MPLTLSDCSAGGGKIWRQFDSIPLHAALTDEEDIKTYRK